MTKLEKLIKLVECSVCQCYIYDMPLIEKRLEQACVARIFYYMQAEIEANNTYTEFRGLALDSEYNKHGEGIKRTFTRPNGSRPDIILHQRGCDIKNTLVLEFKCHNRTKDKIIDFNKLCDCTDKNQYDYFLGMHTYLHKQKTQFTFFQGGKEKAKEELRHD